MSGQLMEWLGFLGQGLFSIVLLTIQGWLMLFVLRAVGQLSFRLFPATASKGVAEDYLRGVFICVLLPAIIYTVWV